MQYIITGQEIQYIQKIEMIVENGEIDNNGIVKNCIIIAMDNIKFEDNDMMISSLGDFFSKYR